MAEYTDILSMRGSMLNREEIAAQALSLSEKDRFYLADVLEASLINKEEIAEAWTIEIDKRLKAYDAGEVEAVDAMEMLDRLWKKYSA